MSQARTLAATVSGVIPLGQPTGCQKTVIATAEPGGWAPVKSTLRPSFGRCRIECWRNSGRKTVSHLSWNCSG